MQEAKGWHSRGYVPHFDSPENVQHVVFRTLGSIPAAILAGLDGNAGQRRTQVDAILDSSTSGHLLAMPAHARIVQDCLMHFDSQRYNLIAWCIMPNHVHVLIEQIEGYSLGQCVRSWKQFSTTAINRLSGSSGQIWAHDYFDRFIRHEDHFAQTLGYIENNPVKAGLVTKPEDWPFSSATNGLSPSPSAETMASNAPPCAHCFNSVRVSGETASVSTGMKLPERANGVTSASAD